jgi:competence protein ComEC
MGRRSTRSRLIVVIVLALDVAVWYRIAADRPRDGAAFHFLDVGQGDATVVEFPGGVRMMTDAGPGGAVVRSLERAIGARSRYIDLAVISHPQLDHFGGFSALLDRYRFGAFIVNGRSDTPAADQLRELTGKLAEHHVPVVALMAGDAVRFGDSRIDILSPDKSWLQSGELNDTGFVERVAAAGATALLTADIDANVEADLASKGNIRADILKVAHHGSKYSSGAAFLAAVDPVVAVIEVGAKNTYGHPAPETLARLASSTVATVFRTDRNGNVTVTAHDGMLRVFAER